MTLNELMEEGTVIEIESGTATATGEYLPSSQLEEMFGELLDQPWYEWQLMHGLSNQHGYNGPILHESEFIGGGLEKHIRTTPGKWCVLYATDDEGEIYGWVLAYAPTPL